jgi:cytochrome c oxidase subunit 1
VHFWGSFLLMNMIFGPMFLMGLIGVNRRLYDAGLQYDIAQPTLQWNVHMTYGAVLLGLFQLPFVWNLVVSARRGAVAPANPWGATTLEWETASPPPPDNFDELPVVSTPPYTYAEEPA